MAKWGEMEEFEFRRIARELNQTRAQEVAAAESPAQLEPESAAEVDSRKLTTPTAQELAEQLRMIENQVAQLKDAIDRHGLTDVAAASAGATTCGEVEDDEVDEEGLDEVEDEDEELEDEQDLVEEGSEQDGQSNLFCEEDVVPSALQQANSTFPDDEQLLVEISEDQQELEQEQCVTEQNGIAIEEVVEEAVLEEEGSKVDTEEDAEEAEVDAAQDKL